jgi:hypothetical protein
MLNNWSRLTEEEMMNNRRKGVPQNVHIPAEIQVFKDALVKCEKEYLYKNRTDFGVSQNTTEYMSNEDKENHYLAGE